MTKDAISLLIARVDEKELRANLFYLSKDPLPYRKVNHTVPGHAKNTLYEADEFIASKLRSWGYQVHREGHMAQAFRCDSSKPKAQQYSPPLPNDPWYTVFNLRAEKTGSHDPKKIIVFVSHKDSPSWADSPGAYDNGVGTVANLEIARLLAGHPTRHSVWFLFCNEEHCPWSSVTAANDAKERGEDIIAVFNMDSMGGKSKEDLDAGRKTNVTRYVTPEGERLADLVALANETYGIGLVQRKHKSERPGDDDGSFLKAGYPTAVANLGSMPYADPNYHAEGDTPENVDLVNLRMATQVSLAAMLMLDQGALGRP